MEKKKKKKKGERSGITARNTRAIYGFDPIPKQYQSTAFESYVTSLSLFLSFSVSICLFCTFLYNTFSSFYLPKLTRSRLFVFQYILVRFTFGARATENKKILLFLILEGLLLTRANENETDINTSMRNREKSKLEKKFLGVSGGSFFGLGDREVVFSESVFFWGLFSFAFRGSF